MTSERRLEMVARAEFTRFAERELPGLLRYAVMLTGDAQLAQDIVQDVMVTAHRQWDRIEATDHPRLYVKTMVARAFLSSRRRWSVRHIRLLSADERMGGPSIADHAAAIVDRDDMWRRLATLPSRQRAVLVLRYYEQLTDPEIAAVLACTAGTVRGYASRALATLRLDVTGDVLPAKEPR